MSERGRIEEELPGRRYRVTLDSGRRVTAHVDGARRAEIVRLIPGDRVEVEITRNDRNRGRIVAGEK